MADSRNEALLENLNGAENAFGDPQSPIEAILQNLLGAENEIGEPQSRNEALLKQFLESGGGGGGSSDEMLIKVLEGSVEDLIIPEGTTKINKYFGNYFKSLKTITFPSTLESIGENVFYQAICPDVLKLPEGLKTIESGFFYGCVLLNKEIDLPSTITNIGNSSLSSTYSSTKIICRPTTPPTIGANTFGISYSNFAASIYVPAESVDAYKSAENWSKGASYIFAIEE